MSTTLNDLAITHKADKSSLYHNFAEKYDRLLSSFRESFLCVLEIGVGNGQSIRMWSDYFPKAIIHAADIEPSCQSCQSYSSRIRFHLIDQKNPNSLNQLKPFSPFDLIIDDGNHFWFEQIVTFNTLFQFVRRGGIYIVEDTCTSYWKEYGNFSTTCVDYFKGLVDLVNFNGARGRIPPNPSPDFGNWERGWHRREDCQPNLPDIESVHFMNSIIVAHKR